MPAQTMDKPSGPPEIKWSESIAIGVGNVDEQHKHMLSVANKFLRALHMGYGDKILAAVIRDLREYTLTHFRDEEELMSKVHYPHLLEHQREHQNLTMQVKRYQEDIYRKNPIDPVEFRAFIKQWLIGHMIGSDGRIAAFMRDPGTPEEQAEPPKQAEETPQEPEQGKTPDEGAGDEPA